MVAGIDRTKFRITHSPFSDVDSQLIPQLEGLVLAYHIAEGETQFLGGLDGYDVRIEINEDYEGHGTSYLVDVLKGENICGSAGIGIKNAA
jgi:hypothetical protein